MTTTSPPDTVVVENPSHELMLGVSSYDIEFDLDHFLDIEKKKRLNNELNK